MKRRVFDVVSDDGYPEIIARHVDRDRAEREADMERERVWWEALAEERHPTATVSVVEAWVHLRPLTI